MNKCPYCGGELTGSETVPVMNWRRDRIYTAVAAAGRVGVSADELIGLMYRKGQTRTPGAAMVLRVQICEINKTLKNSGILQRIKAGAPNGYHLAAVKP